MKKTDRKIKQLLKNTDISPSTLFTEHIHHLAEDLVRQSGYLPKNKRRNHPAAKYVPAALLVLLLAAYPVKAAVDYVNMRLTSLPEEEKETLRTMVYENQEQNASLAQEAIRYSRDFSASEQNRYETLWNKYQDGTFPKGSLLVLEDAQTAETDTVCYDPKNKYMYLPPQLTDESLLQIIDFYHKLDYSLQTSDATRKYKEQIQTETSEASHKTAKQLSEAQAIDTAASYVKTMYGISVKNLTSSLRYDSDRYFVTFQTADTHIEVSIHAQNGAFQEISMEKDGFAYYRDNLVCNQNLLKKRGKKAKTIAMRLLGDTSVITDAYIQYKINADGLVPHGSAVCLFDLEDGNRIRISYSIAEDTLWGAVLETGGAGTRDTNVGEDETRVFIELE